MNRIKPSKTVCVGLSRRKPGFKSLRDHQNIC